MKNFDRALNITSFNLTRQILISIPFIFSIFYLSGPLLTFAYQDKYPQLRLSLIIFSILFGFISFFKINIKKVKSIKISKVSNLNLKVSLISFFSIILIILYLNQFGEAKALGGIEARELNSYANTNIFVFLRYLLLSLITCNCILIFERKFFSRLTFIALMPGFIAIFSDLLVLGTRRNSLFLILIFIYTIAPKFKPNQILLLSVPLFLIAIFSFFISGLRVYVDFVDKSLLEVVLTNPLESFNFALSSILANAGNSEFGLVGASLPQYIDYSKSIDANYFLDLFSNFLNILPNKISPFDFDLPKQNADALFSFYFGEMFIYFGNLSIIFSPMLILIIFNFALTRKMQNPITFYVIGSSADFLRTNLVEYFLGFLIFYISYRLLKLILNPPDIFIAYKNNVQGIL